MMVTISSAELNRVVRPGCPVYRNDSFDKRIHVRICLEETFTLGAAKTSDHHLK